jgi:transglutaminase-like putative cysteine protease
MEDFLRPTEIIDWKHPTVLSKAKQLSTNATGTLQLAQRCFEWVRDQIQHSIDFRRNPVTCSASEVLLSGTGFCYAKSHLLAALLRANGIPAGFCYQRLSGERAPYTLHGLNAIHLPNYGWYRADPRGNKPGVNAQFNPPVEQLAFNAADPEEKLFPEILPDPLDVVVTALHQYNDWEILWSHLPDWEHPSLSGASIRTAHIYAVNVHGTTKPALDDLL